MTDSLPPFSHSAASNVSKLVGSARFHFQSASPSSSHPAHSSSDSLSIAVPPSATSRAARTPSTPAHFNVPQSPLPATAFTFSQLSPSSSASSAAPSTYNDTSPTHTHTTELFTPRLHTSYSPEGGDRRREGREDGNNDTSPTDDLTQVDEESEDELEAREKDGQLSAEEVTELFTQLLEVREVGVEAAAEGVVSHTATTRSSLLVNRASMRNALAAEAKLLSLQGGERTLDSLTHHLWKMESEADDGVVEECAPQLDRAIFSRLASRWNVPSQHRVTEELDREARVYESRLPIGRRLLAHWSVEGPMSSFVMLVVALQLTMGLYYFIHTANDERRDVLGWGIAFAKLGAGVIYPTLALLLLSTSRRLATFLRRWRFVSRFINWDRSQHFHVCMAVTLVVFALLHSLSHLTGDFVRAAGSESPLLSNFPQPITYRAMIGTRAGVTGLIALSILLLMCATSIPAVRRSRFQLFQYTHLLIWPFVAVLLAHGTGALIARPVLGYWLIVPMLAVLWDRIPRLINVFRPVPGCAFRVVRDKTLVLSIPRSSVSWPYRPGQYILLRVPAVSRGQWHPFTVVGCTSSGGDDDVAELWIRELGDWTGQLMHAVQRQQAAGNKRQLTVNLDGPFGSPADKLTEYERIVIVGTGIGVTPYAGWLQDVRPQQRVDFHWAVRDSASFSWFSSLLNSLPLRRDTDGTVAPRGLINIRTYATGLPTRTTLQYVCRVLLEKHRTITHPQSFITGLECETLYGRPNIASIFHYAQQLQQTPPSLSAQREKGDSGGKQLSTAEALTECDDLSQEPSTVVQVFDSHKQTEEATVRGTSATKRGGSGGVVGVFFCGPNYLGMEISDRCRMESAKGDTRFDFVGEVF